MAEPVRVAIVNDYEVVVRGLAAMLAPYADRIRVVDTAAGEEPSEESDMVLYDTFAASPTGQLDCTATLAAYGATHLVVYTWPHEAGPGDVALDGEVAGYLSKAMNAAELVEALERVYAGEVVGAAGLDAIEAEPGDWPGRQEGLSARESEIIALIVQGLSNDQIADRAYLSINTVKSYIRTAYRKIKVTSRSQALLWGIDHGFRSADSTSGPTVVGDDHLDVH